jgi:hypothetical protein
VPAATVVARCGQRPGAGGAAWSDRWDYQRNAGRSRLFQIQKSFRMARSDLRARPIYHRRRDPIEAHLTVVFAALAPSRRIEQQTGWSIRKFVKTARRYRTIQIQAGSHTFTAADPIPASSASPRPDPRPNRCTLIWPNSGRCRRWLPGTGAAEQTGVPASR